jgi:hypothetical protein
MLAKGGGSIVNISSMAARAGLPAMSVYGASKAALEALTRSWAAEFSARGVRVNTVMPGPTRTETLIDTRQTDQRRMLTRTLPEHAPGGSANQLARHPERSLAAFAEPSPDLASPGLGHHHYGNCQAGTHPALDGVIACNRPGELLESLAECVRACDSAQGALVYLTADEGPAVIAGNHGREPLDRPGSALR